MWHPASDVVRTEEDQMKLAVMRSLEPQSVSCQFCNTCTKGMDELQLHRLECEEINGSAAVKEDVKADVFTGFGNPDVYSLAIKRKSGSCRTSRISQTKSCQCSEKKAGDIHELERSPGEDVDGCSEEIPENISGVVGLVIEEEVVPVKLQDAVVDRSCVVDVMAENEMVV